MSKAQNILVLGSTKDGATNVICDKLKSLSCNFDLFSTSEFENSKKIYCEVSSHNLILRSDDTVVDFSRYSSIYFRFWPSLNYCNTDGEIQTKSAIISELYGFLQETTQLVINRPLSGMSNSSKLQQLNEISDFGFRTLNFVCSTSESDLDEILERPDTFITKGISGTRTRASSFGSEAVWRLSGLRLTPTFFQVKGQSPEYRAHVVDNTVHVVRIDSPVVDYRYAERDGHQVGIELVEDFPLQLKSKCIDFCVEYDLGFAGFDFITGENGELYLLEVNPSPGFDFYDKKIGGKISTSLAELLLSASFKRFQDPMRVNGLKVGEIFLEDDRRPDLIY